MKHEIAERWVAALRSGQYKQTKSVLYDGAGFCCLGVLCELAVSAGIAELVRGPEGEWEGYEYRYGVLGDLDFETLPEVVRTWAGIASNDGVFGDSDFDNLTHLNDSQGYDFNQIADVIEREIDVL